MKYIKTFEGKITQTALLTAIYNFLTRALPEHFTIKMYQGTISIKDTSIPKYKKTVGYIFISNPGSDYEIHLSSRTLEGSNIDIAANYITYKIGKLAFDIEKDEQPEWLYNNHTTITFERKNFEDIVDLINSLPTDELSIMMIANKYNL
jgi:hypothetical protein